MPQEADKCQELAHSKSTDILAVARERVARSIIAQWSNTAWRPDTDNETALAYADAAISEFLSVLQERELPESACRKTVYQKALESARIKSHRSHIQVIFRDVLSELSRLHKEAA